MHWSNSTDTILVPDRPPRKITVKHVGKDVVQLKWSPVFSENTNGKVLGYRVFYSDVQNKSRAISTVAGPNETDLIINGLRPGKNYSFQMLAFTSKGNGAISASFFARTSSGIKPIPYNFQSSKPRKPDTMLNTQENLLCRPTAIS